MPVRKLSELDWKPLERSSALVPHPRPSWYDDSVRFRARECVRLAAQQTEVQSLADWLIKDERGTWELEAMRLLLRTNEDAVASKIGRLGLSESQVNECIANRLLLLGIEAILTNSGRTVTPPARVG